MPSPKRGPTHRAQVFPQKSQVPARASEPTGSSDRSSSAVKVGGPPTLRSKRCHSSSASPPPPSGAPTRKTLPCGDKASGRGNGGPCGGAKSTMQCRRQPWESIEITPQLACGAAPLPGSGKLTSTKRPMADCRRITSGTLPFRFQAPTWSSGSAGACPTSGGNGHTAKAGLTRQPCRTSAPTTWPMASRRQRSCGQAAGEGGGGQCTRTSAPALRAKRQRPSMGASHGHGSSTRSATHGASAEDVCELMTQQPLLLLEGSASAASERTTYASGPSPVSASKAASKPPALASATP